MYRYNILACLTFFYQNLACNNQSNVYALQFNHAQDNFCWNGVQIFAVCMLMEKQYDNKFNFFLKAGKKNYSDYGCLICCILTHGSGDGLLCAKDGIYDIQNVFAPFLGNACGTLVGKPKLFIIQVSK